MKKLNKNQVYINIPKSLNFTEEFGTLSNKKQEIIKFIIAEFNYRTKKNGAARHNRNTMINFFNISPNLYNELLNLLIQKELIDKTETSSFGVIRKNNGYTLLQTFECNDEESIQYTYTLTDDDCPEFIKRWVADDFQILSKSSYVPILNIKEAKPKTKNQLHQEVIELQSLLLQQQAEIERLKALLSNVDVSATETISMPLVASNEVTDEPVIDNTPQYIFKYGTDDYAVTGWNYLVQVMNNENLTVEEIQDDIYYSDENRTEVIYENLKIYKKFDVSHLRYNVQISA